MIFARIDSRSPIGTPATLSASATHERECSKWIVWPQDGQLAHPWMSRRSPSREVDESRRANRSTRMAAPEAFSRFVRGTRTGVLQIGHRAGLRHVHAIEILGTTSPPLKARRPARSAPPVRDEPQEPRPAPVPVTERDEGQAAELRSELLELLRLLNRAEMEEADVDGYELRELHHLLTRGAYPYLTVEEVEKGLDVLVGNRLAAELTDREYAWDRGRVVGRRFAITTEGKAFLLHALDRTGRID